MFLLMKFKKWAQLNNDDLSDTLPQMSKILPGNGQIGMFWGTKSIIYLDLDVDIYCSVYATIDSLDLMLLHLIQWLDVDLNMAMLECRYEASVASYLGGKLS